MYQLHVYVSLFILKSRKEARGISFCEQVSAGAKRSVGGGTKVIFHQHAWTCRHKQSAVQRIWESLKISFKTNQFPATCCQCQQKASLARKSSWLFKNNKKKCVCVGEQPPHPLYRAIFQWIMDICENRALQQILCTLGCHFARKSVFFTNGACCLFGYFQERAGFFFLLVFFFF